MRWADAQAATVGFVEADLIQGYADIAVLAQLGCAV